MRNVRAGLALPSWVADVAKGYGKPHPYARIKLVAYAPTFVCADCSVNAYPRTQGWRLIAIAPRFVSV